MKYSIIKKNDNIKKIEFPYEIKGFSVKTKKECAIKDIAEILLIDKNIARTQIDKQLDKKLAKILANLNKILMDDDSDDTDATIALDELEKLQSLIIKKYKEFLIPIEYKNLLKNVLILKEEFKNGYIQKKMNEYYFRNGVEEQNNFMR